MSENQPVKGNRQKQDKDQEGLSPAAYQALLEEIGELYEEARGTSQEEVNRSFARTYWEIGRRIIEVEQKYSLRAEYGAGLIDHLSSDLTEKYRRGFSSTNLRHMRRFGAEWERERLKGALSWSHYRALLTVRDPETRKRLEKKAIEEGLSNPKLKLLIRRENELYRKAEGLPETTRDTSQLRSPSGGRLHVYKVVGEETEDVEDCRLDLGFFVQRVIPLAGLSAPRDGELVESFKEDGAFRFERIQSKKKERYAYPARVVRVIDGDTLMVDIDLGFKTLIRERLRLRGVYAPELGTSEGEEAKGFVESRLLKGRKIAIKTYGSDSYGRFLVDVFYKEGETEASRILEEGTFLNNEVLEAGFAEKDPEMRWR
jgi:endonuclease YncB( thermonuclease family)